MPGDLLANLLIFARALRASGVAVRPGGVPDAGDALALVGVARRQDVHDALRAALLFRHDDYAVFDRLFEQFWRVWPESSTMRPRPIHVPPRSRSTLRLLAPGAASAGRDEVEGAAGDEPVGVPTYSPDEAWRRKDFAAFTDDDLARAAQAIAMLAWTPGLRVTRRWVAGPGRTVDLRRLMRANAARGAELFTIPYRVRRVAPRPLVLICDVSGSMEPYTRMLLLFAHAIAEGSRRVEVFVFSTRLTRVTRQFAAAHVGAALARVRDVVKDWSGGTRIGDALRAFNVTWRRRVTSRGPVVLLISDGWDLGDPELLARETARLQRSAYRLVWLNPLLGSPGYEPLARGMRAALPFVDDFLPVHNMASLEELAERLNSLAERRARHAMGVH
jgi:uncharacterized protein with von Willebrand factor type A (vWA) domain